MNGKVAIVTGAGSRGPGLGNGKATAILFAREGAKVFCVDQMKERAEETVAAIRAEGGEAVAHAADVTRAGECAACRTNAGVRPLPYHGCGLHLVPWRTVGGRPVG